MDQFGKSQSPYLKKAERLADVIAAIQVMGEYKFYKLDFASWADRISGDQSKADYWRKVFEEHPEFFRLDAKNEKASLVWRRQKPKRYSVDQARIVSREEAQSIGWERISRAPLQSNELQSLMSVAVEIHSQAIGNQNARRWWVPLVAGFFGALAGALIGKFGG